MIVSNNKPATKRKTNIAYKLAEGLFIWGELARLSGLAHLVDMNFIPRCHGIFCLSSVKKLVMSLEKNCLMKHVLMSNCSYTNYLINIWKKKKKKLIKENSILPCQAGTLARVQMENFHLT